MPPRAVDYGAIVPAAPAQAEDAVQPTLDLILPLLHRFAAQGMEAWKPPAAMTMQDRSCLIESFTLPSWHALRSIIVLLCCSEVHSWACLGLVLQP